MNYIKFGLHIIKRITEPESCHPEIGYVAMLHTNESAIY